MGFSLFSLGNGLAITGLVLAALGYAQGGVGGWIVALVAVGELTILSSVLLLGDDGYQRLEARTSTLLRREPATSVKSVTPRRHGVGMALLIVHLSAYFVVWTACVLGYTRATNEDPFPSVFGLAFEQQGTALVWGVIAAELLFAMAIYVLGPAWWGHFKQLFRYQPAAAPQVPEAPRALPTLRYRVGLGVFVVGNVLATVGLFLPVFGLAKGRMVGVIALIMGAGEVISLSSIFLLGKEGFKELKTRLFAVLKRTPSGALISRQRHRLGATLLALHVVTQFGAVALPIASHYGVIAEGSFPTVLGLDHSDQLKWFLGLLISSELLFFAGVYTLGEDWWGRFRGLFHLQGSDAE
ncbi:MAG: hypothetical protein JRG93_11530 [Deltaproteobacteria bacterium]|nr:hypothetical protein [Deltaproteobacteria bacterium]MBW2403171.1 hypothetical protein [Deltaproteobacteria bacterium]MBW2548227.1 hypothetical protein [Deltaproteobacteria bacterium]